jgi:adenylate cyclase
MNYRNTLLSLLLVTTTQVSAQKSLDSLYSIWEDASKPDSVRSEAYLDYIWGGFVYSMPDSAIALADKLILFSEKTSSIEVTRSAYNAQGVAYYVKGDNKSALELWRQSLNIAEQTGNLSAISASLLNIGNVYSDLGDFTMALEMYNRSLKISKTLSNEHSIALNLVNIGTIYHDQKKYPKALDAYLMALKTEKELEGNGSVYTLSNIGAVYSVQGEFQKALDYFARGLMVSEETGDKGGLTLILINSGVVKYKQKDYSEAIVLFEKGLNLSLEIGSLTNQKTARDWLYKSHKEMGNDTRALEYLEQVQSMDENQNNQEIVKQLQQMKFSGQMLRDSVNQVDADRIVKEAHNETVRKKNRTQNWLIGAGLVALVMALSLFARVRYIRKARATLQVEKDQSEYLLLNILPADIATELKVKGHADARDFKKVSILFTDFKGFTAASEKLSAQELVAEINVCFKAFDLIMEKYQVEKIKTIGDAYMAAGGLPVPNDKSVKNTVLSAIEIQAFIAKRKAKNDALNKPAFEMRVGIHTGPIVAGIVGVKKFAYDIWGDAVNTASRMESSGAVGQVNVSQSTYESLKDDNQFKFESRGKIEAKGKGEMEMYFVSKT